jgi:Flp pilus assembly pilin Flp
LLIYDQTSIEEGQMNQLITTLCLHVRSLLVREEGQDLTEYSLVLAMVAFGAITGMGQLAAGINTEFANAATLLTSSTS